MINRLTSLLNPFTERTTWQYDARKILHQAEVPGREACLSSLGGNAETATEAEEQTEEETP